MYILSEEELGEKKSLSRNWNVFGPRGVLGYLVKYVVLDVIELGQGMEINWSKLIIVLLETPTAVWNYRISCPLLGWKIFFEFLSGICIYFLIRHFFGNLLHRYRILMLSSNKICWIRLRFWFKEKSKDCFIKTVNFMVNLQEPVAIT